MLINSPIYRLTESLRPNHIHSSFAFLCPPHVVSSSLTSPPYSSSYSSSHRTNPKQLYGNNKNRVPVVHVPRNARCSAVYVYLLLRKRDCRRFSRPSRRLRAWLRYAVGLVGFAILRTGRFSSSGKRTTGATVVEETTGCGSNFYFRVFFKLYIKKPTDKRRRKRNGDKREQNKGSN